MAEPGCKKPTGSGRQKGSINKDKADLHVRAKKLGIDPFEVLLYFAKGDWESLGYTSEKIIRFTKSGPNEDYTIDPSVRAKCASEACQYLYTKLRSVEVKIEDKDERPLEHMSDEELDNL